MLTLHDVLSSAGVFQDTISYLLLTHPFTLPVTRYSVFILIDSCENICGCS